MKAYTCGECGHIQLHDGEGKVQCKKCKSQKVKQTWSKPAYDNHEWKKEERRAS